MLLIAKALLRPVFEPFLKGSVSTSNLTEPEKGQRVQGARGTSRCEHYSWRTTYGREMSPGGVYYSLCLRPEPTMLL